MKKNIVFKKNEDDLECKINYGFEGFWIGFYLYTHKM